MLRLTVGWPQRSPSILRICDRCHPAYWRRHFAGIESLIRGRKSPPGKRNCGPLSIAKNHNNNNDMAFLFPIKRREIQRVESRYINTLCRHPLPSLSSRFRDTLKHFDGPAAKSGWKPAFLALPELVAMICGNKIFVYVPQHMNFG